MSKSAGHRRSSKASSRYLLLLTLLYFLTLPQSTLELGFPFGSADIGDANRQAVKRRPFEKKFKFHKIERVYEDEDYAATAESANDGSKDIDEDDDDDHGETSAAVDSAAAESSQANEAEEVQFERVRSAHKERKGVAKIPAAQAKKKSVKQRQEDSAEQSPSGIGSLFGGLFGSAQQKPGADSSAEADAGEQRTQANGIIDWLKWLGERTGRLAAPAPAPTPAPKAETWLSYLNRWPFNSFFPFGQPAKPIRMPRRSASGAQPATSAAQADDNADASPTMSQAHFESLLHTLPGFVVDASRVADTECRQQLQIIHRQLRGNKLWTLHLLDATGKISAGLLRGNINQFGDFDLCTQVKTLVKVTPDIPMRIRGKYCLAHIETQTAVPALKVPLHLAQGRGLWNSHLGNPGHFVPRYGVANWGICIPHLCPAQVVQEMLEANLRRYNHSGVEFHIEVDDNDCYMQRSVKFGKLLRKDGKFAITVLLIALLIVGGIASLCFCHWSSMRELVSVKLKSIRNANASSDHNAPEPIAEPDATTETEANESADMEATSAVQTSESLPLKVLLQEVFRAFSPQRTLTELVAADHLTDEFPIFHILKLGATFALYVCLKYLLIGHLPITNRDKLVRAVNQPSSILFRSPIIYMDVLLVISGFLAAHQLSAEMECKSCIHLLKRMAAKMARYLPTVYVVLFVLTWVLPHLGAGPLWTNLIGQNTRLCEQQMWRNVFSAQNAIDFEEACSPMTIQLALEVQLFLLGPLIVWLYYTDADAAFFVYGAIHALSVAARYSRTQREHLSMTLFHGMNVSKFYRTANLLYASPVSRATPYLLGIGAGMLHRAHAGSLDIAQELVPLGWAFAALGIVWCFWSPSAAMRTDYIYSASEAASYAAWCPLILGLALVWIIFMFPKGENSVLRFLTTLRPILFLSRIAFPMQLVSYVVVLYNTASVKEPRRFQMSDLINFNEIGVIVGFGVALAFLIDVPAQQIRRLLVNRIFTERMHKEHDEEPSSGAEPSEAEAEASEDCSEHVGAGTPEPQESVWTSDPEEEEREYNAKTAAEETEEIEAEKNTSAAEAARGPVETEVDEETEIAEEDEIKKRPTTPPTQEEDEAEVTELRVARRRRRLSDD